MYPVEFARRRSLTSTMRLPALIDGGTGVDWSSIPWQAFWPSASTSFLGIAAPS
ncbi:hypothetical protein [Mycobacterium sp.]|uniref:hypothetical protein n=1 Tax=Mycobacterium sp. TaxID=1785 RepID=UPI0028B59559|nr:hypothetical protein [Mycobacterium sp.]MDT5055707.1 hypothetical protein [Mycobacterium sp.]